MHRSNFSKAAAFLVTALVLSGCNSNESAPTQSPPAAQASPASPTSQPPTESSPSATPESKTKTYTTIDGAFEFEYPSGWEVVDGPTPPPGGGSAVSVLDAGDRTMATLTTGFPAIHDVAMARPSKPTELDYQEMPAGQLPLVFPESVNAFNFQLTFNPNTNETGATMSINNLAAGSDHGWLRGFDIDGATGASFARWIDAAEILPGVSPDLQAAGGAAVFEAYQQTPEYEDVKAMLLSLRQPTG